VLHNKDILAKLLNIYFGKWGGGSLHLSHVNIYSLWVFQFL